MSTKNRDGYDLLIVGGGPAGLTSSIYSARAGLRTLLIERMSVGGLIGATDIIENYPGFPDGIKGIALGERMKRQAERFGAEIVHAEVSKINPLKNNFKVKADKDIYSSMAVIIASGTIPKKLNIPGEDNLRGRGVSYCATCDGPLYKNKDIAVIGCGNAGLQEGLFLLNFVKSITFVEFLPDIPGEKILQERLRDKPKVKFMLNCSLVSINGKESVRSITVQNRTDSKQKEIFVDGVFIYIGQQPMSFFLKGILKLDDDGFIITNENLETSIPGIFAAGDIRSKKIRQAITACAEGATAAINAYHYIESNK